MEYSVFEALDMFNGTIHKSIDMSHGNINMNNFTGEILFFNWAKYHETKPKESEQWESWNYSRLIVLDKLIFRLVILGLHKPEPQYRLDRGDLSPIVPVATVERYANSIFDENMINLALQDSHRLHKAINLQSKVTKHSWR